MNGNCTICGEGVAGSSHPCPRCETPHHTDCWEYNEGCGVYGCKAALVVAQGRVAELEIGDDPEEDVEIGWIESASLLPAEAWQVIGALLSVLGIVAIAQFATTPGFFGWAFFLTLIPLCTGVSVAATARGLPSLLSSLSPRASRIQYLEETPLKRLEARLGEDPKNLNTLEMVAYIYFSQARFEDSLEIYEKSLAIHELQPRISLQRAKCLERLGRIDEAVAAFRELAASSKNDDVLEKCAWWVETLRKRQAAQGLEVANELVEDFET